MCVVWWGGQLVDGHLWSIGGYVFNALLLVVWCGTSLQFGLLDFEYHATSLFCVCCDTDDLVPCVPFVLSFFTPFRVRILNVLMCMVFLLQYAVVTAVGLGLLIDSGKFDLQDMAAIASVCY